MNIKLTSSRGEKTRMEELISQYMDHKHFLDKLAPKEWHDSKFKLKEILVEELREKIDSSR